jgi:hypothetical protein
MTFDENQSKFGCDQYKNPFFIIILKGYSIETCVSNSLYILLF